MKIFVISLKDSSSRREEISKSMQSLNIEFEFFDAIDGRKKLPKKYEHMVDRGLAKNDLGRNMLDAEFACALSHKLVYEKMISENIVECIILEDDAIIRKDFLKLIEKDYIKTIDKDMILFMHYRARRYLWDFGKKIFGEYRYYNCMVQSRAATGYYLNNSMAKIMLRACAPIKTVADWCVDINKYAVFVSPRIITHPPLNKSTITKRFEDLKDYGDFSVVSLKKNIVTIFYRIVLLPIFFLFLLVSMFFGKNIKRKLMHYISFGISKTVTGR